jgi:hypothetical protein
MAARVQTMHPCPGQAYSPTQTIRAQDAFEALRSLKRQLAKAVYRQFPNDHTGQPITDSELT